MKSATKNAQAPPKGSDLGWLPIQYVLEPQSLSLQLCIVIAAFPKEMPSRTLQTLSHFLRTTASSRSLSIPPSPKLYTTTRNASSAPAKRLEGKTVLITGASSGIGRSTAKEFARTAPKNLRLILTARRLEKLHELAQEIREEVGEGVRIHNVKMDVSKPAEVSAFVDGLPEEFKSVDVLVNNACVSSSSSSPSHLFFPSNAHTEAS